MRISTPCIVVALATALVSGCGDDDGGTTGPRSAELLWQDAYDSGGEPGDARDVANAVAACGGLVYAVGETAYENDGTEDYFHVRAYEASTGLIAWQRRIESGPGDSARDVACDSERVVVTGVLGRSGTVQSYDAITGEPQWSFGIRDGDENDLRDFALRGEHVYVVSRSTITSGPRPDTSLIRRALNSSDGAVVWEDRTPVNAPWASAALDADGDRVCTLTGDQETEGLGYSVRCVRRGDGAPAWEADLGTADRVESEVLRFVPGGDVLIVASANGDKSILQAFAARDGTSLWRRRISGLSVVVDMATTEERVLVAGVEFVFEERNDGDVYERDILFVEGRDPDSGVLLWKDEIEDTQPRAIAVDGRRLVMGGVSWQSWVYDALDGRLLVEEPAAPQPDGRWMWDLAAEAGRYFMVGAFFHDLEHSGNLDFAVRAYSRR
jgi:outer membrane protein assembly factor BamB